MSSLSDVQGLSGTPYVSAVMPCLNEERTIARCVEKASSCFQRLGISGEVVVVDNGSTDRSIEFARDKGARIIYESTRGYGSALRSGIQAAKGTIVVVADADESYDWSNLDAFIAAVEAGSDLVIGNRFRGGIKPGAMPFLNRYVGNPVLSTLARLVFDAPIKDFHCGMRALRASAFRDVRCVSNGMEYATEMIIEALRHGLKVSEIPTVLYPDFRDRPPHLRPFRDGWRHLRLIISHAPKYFFTWPGIAMSGAGCCIVLVQSAGLVIRNTTPFGLELSLSGALLSTIGVISLWQGIIATAIIKSRFSHRPQIKNDEDPGRSLAWFLLAGAVLCITGIWVLSFGSSGYIDQSKDAFERFTHLSAVGMSLAIMGAKTMYSSFVLFLIQSQESLQTR